MSADRKILVVAGALGLVTGIATGITSDIGWLRGCAAMSMLYSLGVLLIGATGVKEATP